MNAAQSSVPNDALTTALASAPIAIATPSTALNHPLLQSSWTGASSAIAFIDASVADYQTLVAGIAPGTEVHILDSSQDAITQITNTLLGRHNISSLHIVSHGEAGGLDFGTGKLNLKDLPAYAAQLQSWSNALTDDADLLLYGCNVAQGELGKAFTSILSQLTGADVAASDDLTGNSALGGNWTLEYQTGAIESAFGFQVGIATTYQGTLASSLVRNINPGSGSSNPIGFTVFNNALYFQAFVGTNGNELWKVDSSGTAALVRNINPGSGSSNPIGFTVFNNALYFQADDGTNGSELWKVDSSGTAALVRNINPGSSGSSPAGFTVFNNALYFQAFDSTNGTELWKVDSSDTAALVRNINPGSSSSFPTSFTVFNNALYFQAFDSTNGTELWKVDSSGTAALVRDISPGSSDSFPNDFTVFNNALYFRAFDSTNGTELWKVDSSGTAALVSNINPGSNSSFPGGFTVFNNALYFGANDGTNGTELWKVDSSGTAALVRDISPGSNDSFPGGFTVFNNALYFGANDGTNGTELWKVDSSGTAALVRDISPGSNDSFPDGFTVFNNALYFGAFDGTNGKELLKVDSSGTAALVSNINPGSNSSFPTGFTVFNNALYFRADDGTNGTELWKEDGLPSVSLSTSTATITEGNTGTFTLSRTDTTGALTVNLTIDATSTAVLGSTNDYTLDVGGTPVTVTGNNLSVTIPDTQASVTLNMAALAEAIGFAEAADTLKLNLATGTGYGIGSNNTATITIAQNGFIVTTTSDTGEGSLRQALLNANAIAGTDTITFAGATFTDTTADTITLASGLTIDDAVTLQGTGAAKLAIAGTGAIDNGFALFTINAGKTASFSGLTFQDATYGIRNNGTIASFSNSAISNTRYEGINNSSTGTIALLTNSTISGVQLQGIYNGGTITTLSNTTISGNTSYGIYNDGTISTAVNNTIAANGTTGILNSGSGTIANLRNNLLVGNGTNTISGTITNQNTNLFGTFAEFYVDSVFKDNGGSTKTYALLPSSMAIDFDLSPGAPTTDQRGISRVGAVDIGAFESRGFTVAITGGNNQSTKVNTAFANPLTVTVSSAFNEPVAGGKINYVSNSSEIPIDPNAFFSGSPATLDSSGNASAIATANNYTGSYMIAVAGSGIATASFNLTNTPPNALPTSANKSVNFNEDTVYTFRTADFPFTDSDSGDTLQAVQITQLPTAGTGSLTLNSNPVNANDAIALADITSGKLKFTPFANAFGTNYTSFQFKVSDGNGFSSAAYTMALNVNAVDDTVFTVTNTNDSGLGSLRQAVLDANADAGTENITFSLPTGAQTISLLSALPVLIESVNILNTTGAIGLTIRANTAGAFSLFSVALGQTVAFDQLTLSNGNSGIVNRGTIASLNNSILFGNTTGIANANGGTITSLSNSTISGNDTGVLNSSSTITSLSNSTISNNNTGISNSSGTITSLNNSTISGNTTGGIVNLNGTINTLSNSTISGNQDGIANVLSGNASATIGTLSNNTISGNTRYGIFNQGGTLTTVSNNTIAGNTTSSIANSGSLTTVFNNLLISNGDNSPTAPITVDASKNLRGTFANTGVDSTLRDNGGATQTHALLPNSVAINDGISTGAPTADQRGISRVGAVDIGAFESRGFTLAVTSGNNQSAVHNTAFNPLIVTVSSAFSEPVNGGTVFFDAPTTGASLADPAPPAVTIANGQVSLSPTANNTIGSYTVAASTRGGTNTATFSLTNTNTRPTVNTVSKMGTEDTTVSFSSADFTSQFSDANSDSLTKIQITSLSTKGILRLGSTAVSLNQELTAAQLSTLTYSPNANSNGADSFGWNGFDGAEYGTTGATVNLTIAAVNDAPTLTGNATLPAVTQNTTNPSGSTITTLFGPLFSDIDTGASLSGLAIVGNLTSPNTQGQWQYSLDGLTWFGIGFVNDGTNALALTASTRVRFVPVTGYNGTPSGLSVRALDNTYSSGFTTGTTRVTVDTTTNGGSSAIAGGTPTTLDTSVVPSLPQLVWRNSSSGQNAVWQLNTFTVATSYFLPTLTDPNWQIAATTADFNQDGFVDLLWRNQRTGENAIWELNSTGYQTSYLITPIADLNWQIAGTADFNSDGTPDILWRNAATGQNSVWQQRGATLQSNYLLPTLAEAGWQLAATTADFNQDGVTDLLWRNQRTGANAIWQMNRTGYQTSAFITPVADTNWQIMGTGDFNRDGTADIVWRNKASGDNAIWQMQGATLQSGFLLPTVAEANWQIAGVADLGGDSTPELLWRNKPVGQTVLWQLNGFSYTTTTALPNLTDPNWSVKPFVAPLNPGVLNPVVAT